MTTKLAPLFLSWLLFLALSLSGVYFAFFLNDGNFVYALDDTYIHMSVAKHIAEFGIWGVTKYGLASASSSPLWTLILTGLYMLENGDAYLYVPIAVNMFFALLVLNQTDSFTERYISDSFSVRLTVLLTLVVATPLFTLSMIGMEHTMQLYITLLLVFKVVDVRNRYTTPDFVLLLAYAFFLAATRYDSFAVIAAVAAVAYPFLRTKSAWIMAVAVVPPALFAIWSLSNDLGVLPSSIIAKSAPLSIWLDVKLKNISASPILLVLTIVNTFLYFMTPKEELDAKLYMKILFVASMLMLVFGHSGWLYRYDAYIVAMSAIAIIWFWQLMKKRENKDLKIVGLGLLIILLLYRAITPFIMTIASTHNIYAQHIQTANMIKTCFPDMIVAANDIGAITYFNEMHLIDMAGLGSYEVAKLLSSGAFTNEKANAILRREKVEVIIVYERWFKDVVFEDFKKIAEYESLRNVVTAPVVSVFVLKNKVEGLSPAVHQFLDTQMLKENKVRYYDK